MKRKSFLGSLLASPLLAMESFQSNRQQITLSSHDPAWKIPPYLKPGDTIGITCPAGYMTLAEIQPAVQALKSWGFNLRVGKTVGLRDFIFGGTDAERLADFQQMLDDPTIQAIMCARGGYGCIRIVDQIDWRKFAAEPKWIV